MKIKNVLRLSLCIGLAGLCFQALSDISCPRSLSFTCVANQSCTQKDPKLKTMCTLTSQANPAWELAVPDRGSDANIGNGKQLLAKISQAPKCSSLEPGRYRASYEFSAYGADADGKMIGSCIYLAGAAPHYMVADFYSEQYMCDEKKGKKWVAEPAHDDVPAYSWCIGASTCLFKHC